MVTAMYGAQQPMPSMSYALEQNGQSANDEQYISTFFCRALYDYETTDASSLSFRKDDVIEVLTRLESGWWDGLLGEERGWFPSNYVEVISDHEAEAALNNSEFSIPQSSLADDDPVVDMVHSMSQALSQSDRDGDWLNGDEEYSLKPPVGSLDYANGHNGHPAPTQHSDFWVPRVSEDGRIFYVNTQTGQHSRDLPQEVVDYSDGDMAGLTPQSSSRAGPSAGLGLAAVNGAMGATTTTMQDGAGFGIPRRSRTPEPWVKRLADDGMSYYYVNKVDGQVSWTLPEPNTSAAYSDDHSSRDNSTTGSPSISTLSTSYNSSVNGRLRSGSSVSRRRERGDSAVDRLSIHSEDSEVFPLRRDRSESSASVKKTAVNVFDGRMGHHPQQRAVAMELTAAEESARALQEALSPPAPESAVELSNQVREAITAVVQYLKPTTSPRRPVQYKEVDALVLRVVSAVRNLLYVTATPSGHIPSHLYARDVREVRASGTGQTLQSHLKAAQRKVAGTLSKLVLSALAMQYDPGLSGTDKPNRMESDVAELERAVVAFVTEVQFFQEQNPLGKRNRMKRLYGVFSTANIGLGLPGAGAAGDWKGFGYSALDEDTEAPQRVLDAGVLSELKTAAKSLDNKLAVLLIGVDSWEHIPERFFSDSPSVLGYLSWVLHFIGGINVARHVDIDGIRPDTRLPSTSPQYMQTVEKARELLRKLEVCIESLYEDGASLFLRVQALGNSDGNDFLTMREQSGQLSDAFTLTESIKRYLTAVVGTMEDLLAVGFDQANIGQGDYRNSLEWRRSRVNVFDSSISTLTSHMPDISNADDEYVDMELALGRPGRMLPSLDSANSSMTPYQSSSLPSQMSSDLSRSDSFDEPITPTYDASGNDTQLPSTSPDVNGSDLVDDDASQMFLEEAEEEAAASSKSPPRTAAAEKLLKLLGPDAPQHYIHQLNADSKPWYLRPSYDQSEILIDPDGGVRAGTPTALVERLTAHEQGDPTFIKNFLMTFKSFMTVDELFELLVNRFWIQAPSNLSLTELDEWTKLKQHVIRARVLNTFKTMVTDDDILEKEDLYILARMKEFASNEEVVNFAAAKQLLILIERAQRGGDAPIKTTNTVPLAPPAPILPKRNTKLRLLDIDPIELSRQLTLMEAALYKKIRPMECLQRSRETKPGRNSDNITSIIQLSNRIANWVAESVLDKEDSRKRATIVKHFINVADRCRILQNFSTMTAVISGLNTPPIRRLKRTWEQVNARLMSQLKVCETTIDTNKNFNNYRSTLARITPPCVPFIGVYLTTLTFINDGAEDNLAGDMINFRKRQKAAEVIQDIKRWQAKPYNFQPVASVLTYLEESFGQYSDGVDYGDQFWNLSLEREPREREDEKMARLLQESGFL